MKNENSIINSDVAYFDPNTYGESGYSLIGPLLLFYKKLVIYGPVGSLIENSYDTDAFRKTSLTPSEFEKYVENDVIVPAGFESFFNKDERSRLFLPGLRITTTFDEDLISSPVLSKKAFSVPNSYKLLISPNKAMEIIRGNPYIKDRLLAEIEREDNLPQRYKDLKQNMERIPEHLNKIVVSREPEELLPAVIIYDLLNNRHIMESEGSAGVHSLHSEFKKIYRAIHEFDEKKKEMLGK